MNRPIIESVLRRDRWIVAGALVLTTALAWAYVLWLAKDDMASHGSMASMPAMPNMPAMADMPGMSAAGPDLGPWAATEFAFTFVMWTVMMVGMMTPSAAPMVLIYTRVARQAEQ